jgi:hypothetical protein
MTFTIEAKQHPLLKTRIGHLYIEMWDAQGNRLEQINGLATDRVTGAAKRVGLPHNQLRAYLNLRDNVWPFGTGNTQATNTHQGAVLFQGSREDVEKALAAAAETAERINTADFAYNLLARSGYNSNSVFNTIALAMQRALPEIQDGTIIKARRLGLSNPGSNRVMFADLTPHSLGAEVAEEAVAGTGFSVRTLLQPVVRKR